VQDPVLTKYQNFEKFFNFEWRNDTVNSFLLHLSKRESMLQRSFFNIVDDDELKIAYVWSKIPDGYRREMQRNSVLQNISEWPEFERALRNAETAVTNAGTKPNRQGTEETTQRTKRHASAQSAKTWNGKKQDRKPSAQTN
jgi:hypothetical protein